MKNLIRAYSFKKMIYLRIQQGRDPAERITEHGWRDGKTLRDADFTLNALKAGCFGKDFHNMIPMHGIVAGIGNPVLIHKAVIAVEMAVDDPFFEYADDISFEKTCDVVIQIMDNLTKII